MKVETLLEMVRYLPREAEVQDLVGVSLIRDNETSKLVVRLDMEKKPDGD